MPLNILYDMLFDALFQNRECSIFKIYIMTVWGNSSLLDIDIQWIIRANRYSNNMVMTCQQTFLIAAYSRFSFPIYLSQRYLLRAYTYTFFPIYIYIYKLYIYIYKCIFHYVQYVRKTFSSMIFRGFLAKR
jgi:hypothetical protein